ncbi:MAG: hypothetical protein V1652_03635 [bacterium]
MSEQQIRNLISVAAKSSIAVQEKIESEIMSYVRTFQSLTKLNSIYNHAVVKGEVSIKQSIAEHAACLQPQDKTEEKIKNCILKRQFLLS